MIKKEQWVISDSPGLEQDLNGIKQSVRIAVYQEAGYADTTGKFIVVINSEYVSQLEKENAELKARLVHLEDT